MKKIQKFFKNLFKQKPTIIKTNLNELPTLIEKSFEDKKKELTKYSAKKITEIKYLHSKTTLVLKKIKETSLEKKENIRLNHAVETSKKQLITQLEKLLEKINPNLLSPNLINYKEYSKKSSSILVNEINSFKKNIVYTSFYHKEEMKELGEYFQEILNILIELNNKFDSTKEIFEFGEFKEKVGAALQKKIDLKEKEKETNSIQQKISSLKKEKQLKEKEIINQKNSEEYVEVTNAKNELINLSHKKQDLKLQISALILNIDRPLNRYKLLVDSNRVRIPIEETEIIHLFLTNPLLALKKDPKAEKFKKILGDVKNAINEGVIELKEKEKEKRIDAIKHIQKYDFFEEVFWKLNELQKKQSELNKTITTNTITKKIEGKENSLKEIEREINQKKEEQIVLEKQKEFIQKNISKEIEGAKNFVQKQLKQTIIIEEEII